MSRRIIGIRFVLAITAAIGAYLSIVHWSSLPVACPAHGIIDCTAVPHGAGSMVGPLPLATWGVVWAMVGWFFLPRPSPRLIPLWSVIGINGIFWGILHEVLDGHLCLWCTAMQLNILGAVVLMLLHVSMTHRAHHMTSRTHP